MIRITTKPGFVHIFSDDPYVLPAISDFDLNNVVKEVKEHKTESGISLLLETQCCEIERHLNFVTFWMKTR